MIIYNIEVLKRIGNSYSVHRTVHGEDTTVAWIAKDHRGWNIWFSDVIHGSPAATRSNFGAALSRVHEYLMTILQQGWPEDWMETEA